MITTILGGIGLFLLGMILMTDGLKAAAGDALRGILRRFTGGTVSAVASGATLTALVQSSSATVLTTIGFVSAGLLTFPQAVGVIFGASLGTTSTGWIVSLLGLKLNVGSAALPFIGIGALMRLLGRGRVPSIGLALAGFGLIFVGIDVLQGGMEGLATRFDPGSFPGASLWGRVLLVGIGALMTVVMQSSSAAVATTLTALHAGTIGIEQAAALVVGQSVGTTVTAGLASVGASVPARRTALAHILFNVFTGCVAFLLLPLILPFERLAGEVSGPVDPALLIAAFHTGFNVIGVLLLAPFTGPFARLITRIVPDRGPVLTRHLDPSVTQLPAVAVEAARRTVQEIAATLVGVLRGAAADAGPASRRGAGGVLESADHAVEETRHFLGRVHSSEAEHDRDWHLSLLHAIDHLDRLIERLRHQTPSRPISERGFDGLRVSVARDLGAVSAWLETGEGEAPVALCETLARSTAKRRASERKAILIETAGGGVDPDTALRQLEALRWLDSSLYHVWRVVHHLSAPHGRSETEADPEERSMADGALPARGDGGEDAAVA